MDIYKNKAVNMNKPEQLQTTLHPEHPQPLAHLQASPHWQHFPLHPVPQIHTFATYIVKEAILVSKAIF